MSIMSPHFCGQCYKQLIGVTYNRRIVNYIEFYEHGPSHCISLRATYYNKAISCLVAIISMVCGATLDY